MHMRTHFLCWLLSLPILLVVLPAQSAPKQPQSLPLAIARAFCVQPLDGTLWAAGPGYRAAFERDGVVFTPALGERAPQAYPLTLRLQGIGRGEQMAGASPVDPSQHGTAVHYERPGCVERYQASADGIAQSFVFDRLPAGQGDLVVRFTCTTDLPLVRADDTGLRFELPGLGGVHIGGVTGIDANDRRMPGTITWADGTIELRLPAAFVETAALPLVLDPQIGPVFSVFTSPLDYQNPDLALLETASARECLCVFERQISAGDRDLRALRFNTQTGSQVGSLLIVSSGATDEHDPAAGAIRMRDVHVVVYERGQDVFARAITTAGTISAEAIVAQGSDDQTAPDVGSDLIGTDDEAIVVWHNATAEKIQAIQLHCSAAGTLSVFGLTDLATEPASTLAYFDAPRITQDGGTEGRYLVVYSRTTLFGDSRTQAMAITSNLALLGSIALTNNSNDEDSAVVAGDGNNWVVVFEQEPTEGGGDNAIVAVPLFWHSQAAALRSYTPVLVTALANVDEIDPAISALDQSYIVAWRRRAAPGSSDTEVFMKTIDPLSCTECEPTVLLANSSSTETNLTTVSWYDGLVSQAFVFWEIDTAGNGDLAGVLWDSADGRSGGNPGCGTGGRTFAGCARAGNASFSVQLRDGPVAFSSFLVLSHGATSIHCGPCELRADPFQGFVSSLVPGQNGLAAYQLSIPNVAALSGAQIVAQWIVSSANPQCPFLGTDFSGVRFAYIE